MNTNLSVSVLALLCGLSACSQKSPSMQLAATATNAGNSATPAAASGTTSPPMAGTTEAQPGSNSVAGQGASAAGGPGVGTAGSTAGSAGAGVDGGTANGAPDAGLVDEDDASTGPSDAGTLDSGSMMPTSSRPLADYNQPGPYGPVTRVLNVAKGTVSGGSSALIPLGNNNDPSAFTLFYPKGAKPGEKYPILTFGNGTLCSPTFYDEIIGHVVSYGYIVIAPNTSNTGTGAEMLQGVDWVIKQSMDSSSPIFGMVDTEKVGAFGHSQGGAGTCRAGADPRIDAIATLSGTSDVANIQCPAFFLTTGGEAGDSPDERIQSTLGATTKPSMYGITVGGNHDEYTDKADEGVTAVIGLTSDDGVQSRAAVAAWFDWQLKDMPEVGELFRSKPCAFCNTKNLKRLDLKGF